MDILSDYLKDDEIAFAVFVGYDYASGNYLASFKDMATLVEFIGDKHEWAEVYAVKTTGALDCRWQYGPTDMSFNVRHGNQ